MIKDYPQDVIASQPIGAWTGQAYRLVVGALRERLAVEDLTQPHWWTLNHVARDPQRWDRRALVERLTPYEDQGIDFDQVFDDLVKRGWMTEDGGKLTLTEEGEDGRLRAQDRNRIAHERMHEGVDTEDFVTTINVLRRMVANLGGDGNLPTP